MTKKLKWRLSKLPTVEELQGLVISKIITQEEARDILFNEVDEKEVNPEALESEIKFLRELVQSLSSGNTYRIVEHFNQIITPTYSTQPWYNPYYVWCSTALPSNGGGGGTLSTNTTGGTAYVGATGDNFSGLSAQVYASSSDGNIYALSANGQNFSEIKTF